MKQQGFLKGSAILLGMVLVTKAIGLAYKIPLTQLLGGSGMAYYSSAFAVFAPLLAASVSGISSSVARLTAESRAFGRYTHLRKLRRTAMIVYPAAGLTAAILLTLLSYPLAKAFLPSPDAMWTLCALAPTLVFAAVLSVQRGYCEGMSNMLPTAASEIIETILRALLGLAGAYAVFRYADAEFAASHGCFGQYCSTADDAAAAALPFAAAAAILAGSLATGIASLSLAAAHRLRGDGITREMLASDPVADSAGAIIRRLFTFSVPIAGAAVIATLSGLIDLFTVPRGLRAAVAAGMTVPAEIPAERFPDFVYGSYTGLALMLCGLVPTFTAMFGKSSLPSLTEAAARQSSKALSARVSGLIRISAMTALPCGAVLTALSREILLLLFSGRRAEAECAAPALTVLGAACIFMSVSLPCLSALQTLGRKLLPMLIMLAGSGIKLVLGLVLIPVPSLGIVGAAIAAAVSNAVICVLSAAALLKSTGTRLHPQDIVKPAFAALMSAETAWLTADVLARPEIGAGIGIRCPAAIAAAALIFAAALWLMEILPKKRIIKYFKKFRKTY